MHKLCMDSITHAWTDSPEKPIPPALLTKLLDGALMHDQNPLETVGFIGGSIRPFPPACRPLLMQSHANVPTTSD